MLSGIGSVFIHFPFQLYVLILLAMSKMWMPSSSVQALLMPLYSVGPPPLLPMLQINLPDRSKRDKLLWCTSILSLCRIVVRILPISMESLVSNWTKCMDFAHSFKGIFSGWPSKRVEKSIVWHSVVDSLLHEVNMEQTNRESTKKQADLFFIIVLCNGLIKGSNIGI